MTNKFIILLHGPMGSGKTTVSKKLNELIVPSARVALPDIRRIVSGDHRENADVARVAMLDLTESYLKQAIPVIVEVVCKADYIEQYKKLSEKHNVTFLPYYIYADLETRWERVCARTAAMMELDALPQSKIAELKPIFAHNQDFYDGLQGELGACLDTTELAIDQVIQRIISDIENPL